MKSDGEHITKHAALLTSYLSEHLKAARLVSNRLPFNSRDEGKVILTRQTVLNAGAAPGTAPPAPIALN